jgi:dTMP kinase
MKFVVFEGVDGSGKSTQIDLLTAFLTKKKIRFHQTREIGGTHFAEKIRTIFHEKILDSQPDSLRDLLLVLAARRDHLLQISSLKDYKLILFDRFIDSTLVYQGQGDFQMYEMIQKAHKLFLQTIQEEIIVFTFIFNSPECLKTRLKEKREKTQDRFDLRSFEKIWKTNELYKDLLKDNSMWSISKKMKRFRIDAELSAEKIEEIIQKILMED